MRHEINVLQRTQIVFVEPSSKSVAVTNAGPPGPSGSGPGGGNTNPILFEGSNDSKLRAALDEAGGNIESTIQLKADDLSSDNGGVVYLAARQFPSFPTINGAVCSLYNGDNFDGIFLSASQGQVSCAMSTAAGQTDPVFQITNHTTYSNLFTVTATGAVDMAEQSTPPSPDANNARVFSRDNGSGKTQLCVLFPTGAVQVIATEP